MAEDELGRLRRVTSRRIDYMIESAGGGIFGGLVFVILVHLLIGVAMIGRFVADPSELIGWLLSLVICLLIAAFFFGLAMVLCSLIVHGLNWSFGYVLSARHAVVVVAGLAGYTFAALPFVFILIQNSVFQSYLILESLFLLLPIFATVVCSVTAAWHESRYTQRYFGKNFEDKQVVQLSIRHLLAGTFLVSILMAFSHGLIGNYWPVILFFAFLITQVFLLLIDGWWQSRKRRRKEKREASSHISGTLLTLALFWWFC